jgi:hypothetical protein
MQSRCRVRKCCGANSYFDPATFDTVVTLGTVPNDSESPEKDDTEDVDEVWSRYGPHSIADSGAILDP